MMNGPMNAPGCEVPEFKVLINLNPNYELPEHVLRTRVEEIIRPLAGEKKRDWMSGSMFRCLPMLIGNQYGFVVCAEKAFTAFWNGGNDRNDVVVISDTEDSFSLQEVKPHFGSGTFTLDHRWILRTPPGVNLMPISAPNYFKNGVQPMFGVIETDNLRRDFIFNMKMTQPDCPVSYEKGEPIVGFILVPRYYVDRFTIGYASDYYTSEAIMAEHLAAVEHQRLRAIGGPENHYRRGVDAYENPFPDHQLFIKKNNGDTNH